MPYMLIVSALQFGNPVPFFIPVKTDDSFFHE